MVVRPGACQARQNRQTSSGRHRYGQSNRRDFTSSDDVSTAQVKGQSRTGENAGHTECDSSAGALSRFHEGVTFRLKYRKAKAPGVCGDFIVGLVAVEAVW